MEVRTAHEGVERVSETGGNPQEYALHSMQIGGATALLVAASREGDPERRPLEVRRVQGIYTKQHGGFGQGI